MATTLNSSDVLPYGEFLDPEHHDIREALRKFATEKIAPKSQEVDRNARFPVETFA